MRADDERIYLVDFGLATSPRFDLSNAERDFVARHLDHDADYAAMRLVNWLVITVCGVPVPASGGPVARNAYVRRCASGDIPQDVPAAVAGILARHAPAAARMNDFCWRLFDGDISRSSIETLDTQHDRDTHPPEAPNVAHSEPPSAGWAS